MPAGLWQRLFVAGVDDGCDNLALLVAMRIVGRFDRASVERALEFLIDRHEALRTTLHRARDGSLEQVIWDRIQCVVDDRDLRTSPDALQEQLRDYVDAWTPVFDVPLVSARVFTLGDAEHAVAIRVHHAIVDGWSCAIIGSELQALYLAFAAGRTPALKPLTLQYRHVCELETLPLTPANEAYWSARFADWPASSVKLAGPPSLIRRPRVLKATPTLEASRTDAFAKIASTARVSHPTAALAAVAASFLVHGQERVRASVVHANRFRPDLRGVVGQLADTLPMEIDLTGDPTYREVIARTHRAWLTTLEHHVSLAQVSRVSGRDFLKGDSLMCDFEFNYLGALRGAAGQAALVESDGESGFEPLDVPLTERRIIAARIDTGEPWALFLSQTDVIQGVMGIDESAISTNELVELGAALIDTLARAVEEPDRPLRGLLAEAR